MSAARNTLIVIAAATAVLIVLAVFRFSTQRDAVPGDNAGPDPVASDPPTQDVAIEQDHGDRVVQPAGEEIGRADNDIDAGEAARSAASAHAGAESTITFFVTEQDFVRVANYWSQQHQQNPSTWVSTLESKLGMQDLAPNSPDLERLAAAAVIQDPRYRYDPPLEETDLQPTCRNYVCRVEIPTSVRVTSNYSAPRMVPGSILNTYDRELFRHGFGHHVVQRNPSMNTTTHYFLANGFEM